MQTNRGWRKAALLALSAVLLAGGISFSGFASDGDVRAANDQSSSKNAQMQGMSELDTQTNYNSYLTAYGHKPVPSDVIEIRPEAYGPGTNMQVDVRDRFEGLDGTAVLTDEEGRIEWEFHVGQEGLYHLEFLYYPIQGKSSTIERRLLIDGELPFAEAGNLAFSRVWVNEQDEFERDSRGNDLRPRQIEAPRWQKALLQDIEGYYTEPYLFYLSAGKHTIALESLREPMAIGGIKLFYKPESMSYAETYKQYETNGYKQAQDTFILVEGEAAARKSDPTLYPIADRSSPTTQPYHVSKIRMNAIGGQNWRIPGQWLAWDIEVPEDGLYRIAIKNRQNARKGFPHTRKLTIDGELPFAEASKIVFPYSRDWNMNILGGDEPYLFYLTKGKHELRLEVVLGDIAPLIGEVQASLLELNAIYRKILMITSNEPDPFRDYQLDAKIPNLLEVLEAQSQRLADVSNTMQQMSGQKSADAAILDKLVYQLDDFIRRPDTIPKRLQQFKLNVGSLGTWILDMKEQPLDIDYLVVASADQAMPRAGATFMEQTVHEVRAFFASFSEDYTTIGDVSDDRQSVTVWIGSGRDQAQVLKSMIDDTFTPQTGIQINLKLVQMGALLPATFTGEGPDVALQIDNQTPVNYAMRNAVEDLSTFPGFREVTERFRESAMIPYQYKNGVYALPEQQIFPMLFYRKDVLEELGLEVPQTWQDVKKMIPVLQQNHMEFALPLEQNEGGVVNLTPNQTFAMFLYQNGGAFYKDNGAHTDLGSEISQKAFRDWSNFYTNYKFSLKFDFPNRFRTGEMSIGVADYTMYNTLSVFAPELRGLWGLAPVPGTVLPDGSINRNVASSGTGVIMMKAAKDKEAAWEFMKWWTNKDTQVRFGREMEGLMGAAARYPTANIEALKELPWPMSDYRSIEEQWNYVKGIPEVPGGYFTGRHLDNAFREVVNNQTNPREALEDYVEQIDTEIQSKRREFKLAD